MEATRRCVVLSITVLSLLLLSGIALAAVPQQMNYQGYLTDSGGNPLNASVPMSFSLYDDESAGSQLWSETQSSVTVTDGKFNVLLGSVTPIPLAFDQAYWLEIDVNGETLTPRKPLTSVAYAFRAHYANVVSFAPAPVPKTGQSTTYATGDDGDLERGVAWPGPRFTDNGDGTVTDNLTGLIWLQNANCFGSRTWAGALSDANTLNSGECGLSDGTLEGDWRLPQVRELQSLVDYGEYNPALPSGHPFTGVQSYYYWSSTTDASYTGSAWA